MQCPFCRSAMQKGRVTLERATLGVLSDAADAIMGHGGVSSARFLYFYPDGTDKRESADLSDRGHRCVKCGALLIEGTPPEEPVEGVACLSCGKPIPPEKTACPACGW